MTLYDPWEVLAWLILPPLVMMSLVILVALLPKQGREIAMIVMAVLVICLAPQVLTLS